MLLCWLRFLRFFRREAHVSKSQLQNLYWCCWQNLAHLLPGIVYIRNNYIRLVFVLDRLALVHEEPEASQQVRDENDFEQQLDQLDEAGADVVAELKARALRLEQTRDLYQPEEAHYSDQLDGPQGAGAPGRRGKEGGDDSIEGYS